MATYYVDAVNGSDANNGLGPDASALTNKPLKTINKAIGSTGLAAAGDTVYLSPAGPFREVSITTSSPASTITVIGDVANKSGFKTAAGVTVAAGPVIWTGYTTNDTSTPPNNPLVAVQHSNFAYSNIYFVEGGGAMVASATGAQNVSFTDCAFSIPGKQVASNQMFNINASFGVALNWTWDRCHFLTGAAIGSGCAIQVNLPTGVGSDYDVNVLIENSIFISVSASGYQVQLIGTGSSANKGGGVRLRNITAFCGNSSSGVGGLLKTATATLSTTIPCTVTNSLIFGPSFSATTAGQITEDYNMYAAVGANVTAGAHSLIAASYAPLFHWGQERIWGGLTRPFGEPMAGSPLLGLGNDGNQTGYEIRNTPRPAGGASALPAFGCYERGNTAAQGTSPAPPSGTYTWQGRGPWWQEFRLPVDTTATTVSVKVQRDGGYTGTLPQLVIVGNDEIGVAGQTITDTGGTGAWNTLTTAAFTPTRAGWVTVRILSNDTSGSSVVEFANFSIS